MKKIISYFLSGIVLCTALLVTPVSAAEVAPAEETITINSTVSVRATNYWTKTTTKLNSVYLFWTSIYAGLKFKHLYRVQAGLRCHA